MSFDLKFDTHGNEKQKEAFGILLGRPEITQVGYGGAAGGGKSYTIVAWLWIMAIKYPGVRLFIARNELKRLKESTLVSYFKFLADYKVPEQLKGKYNAQDAKIVFRNGSEILLLDASWMPSDPLYTRFGSMEFTSGAIDESNELREEAITIISTRVGRFRNDEYGIAPKILETFNPDKGHVYRRFYDPFKKGSMPGYRHFIPALATDNKLLPRSYVENLERSDEITKQRLLYGNFDYDSTPGRIFDYDCILNIFSNPKYNGKKRISVDVARKGKDKCVIFVWDGYEIIDYAIYEKSTNETIQDSVKSLCQKHGVGMSDVIVDEDGVGGGVVDNLGCQGFINNSSPVSPYGARKNEFLRRNFANLKTQCYFEMAKRVNENKIRFSCDATEVKNAIIEELDAVVQIDLDKDGKTKIIPKEKIKEKIGRSPDFSDAMMFRFYYDLFEDFENDSKYVHRKPNDNPYGIENPDAWEAMMKEAEESEKKYVGDSVFDDALDGDVL